MPISSACVEGEDWVDWAQLIYSATNARADLEWRIRKKITAAVIGGIGIYIEILAGVELLLWIA